MKGLTQKITWFIYSVTGGEQIVSETGYPKIFQKAHFEKSIKYKVCPSILYTSNLSIIYEIFAELSRIISELE